MIPPRLLFNRATGLGDVEAQPGEIHPVDPRLVRGLVSSGRAVPAPDGPDLLPAPPLTPEALGLEPPAPHTSRRRR